jgi:hypothetical protein
MSPLPARWSALAALAILAACGTDGPTGDTRPPTVLSFSPAAGAAGVAPSATISATFSEPVDPTTVNATTFVVGVAGGNQIPGTIAVSGIVITFTPSEPLAFRTTFEARISAEIEDLAGNPLASAVTSSFSTITSPPPEHVSPLIQVGATVDGERIDARNEVDEFHLHGNAGAEWILFARSGPEELSSVTMTVHDSLTDELIAEVNTHGRSVELEEWSTGRFVLPRNAPYVVRVTSREEVTYAFRIDAINRAPEVARAAYTVGDTVTEAIGAVGDIDEFTFEGTAGQEVNVSLQLLAAMASGLRLELRYAGAGIQNLEQEMPTGQLDDFGTGRIMLPSTGTYSVRVLGVSSGTKTRTTGTYRFTIYGIDRRPENDAVLRLDGPSISGAIERAGDVDEYTFTGTSGQHVVLHMTTTGTSGRPLAGTLLGADGAGLTRAYSGPYGSDGPVGYSLRATLPHTGTFRLRVQAIEDWFLTTGPYTLEAYTVSGAPEHVPSRIAVGESITAERIDRPGDFDVFTFVGENGRDVNVFLGWAEPDAELRANVAFNIFTAAGTVALDGQSTGRFPVKDSTYTVTVAAHWPAQNHMMDSQGAYAFRVFPIDPRPEGRATAYVLGDTVSGEPLYPAGDVDEYVFELTEQTTLDILWEVAPDGNLVQGLLLAESDPGTAVWAGFATETGPQLHRITLPPGRYRFHVMSPNAQRGSDPFWPKIPSLRYRFVMSRHSPP